MDGLLHGVKSREPKSGAYALGRLDDARAVRSLTDALPTMGKDIIEVRARGRQMIACLVVRANLGGVRLCRSIGLEVRRGATCVFGLSGEDAARVFTPLSPRERAWLDAPSAPRETKVLLIAGGLSLLSVLARDGRVQISALPHDADPEDR